MAEQQLTDRLEQASDSRKSRWTIALSVSVLPFVLRTLVPGDGLADDAWLPLFGAFVVHLIVHRIFTRQTFGWKPMFWASSSHVLYLAYMFLQLDCMARQCKPVVFWLLDIYLGVPMNLHFSVDDPYWNSYNWLLMLLLFAMHVILLSVLFTTPGSIPGVNLIRKRNTRIAAKKHTENKE